MSGLGTRIFVSFMKREKVVVHDAATSKSQSRKKKSSLTAHCVQHHSLNSSIGPSGITHSDTTHHFEDRDCDNLRLDTA